MSGCRGGFATSSAPEPFTGGADSEVVVRHGAEADDDAARGAGGHVDAARCVPREQEFVLILPEAPLDLARARAGELREQVKRLLVTYRDQLVGPVSVAVGVAAFPGHGKTAPMVLRAVDAA